MDAVGLKPWLVAISVLVVSQKQLRGQLLRKLQDGGDALARVFSEIGSGKELLGVQPFVQPEFKIAGGDEWVAQGSRSPR